MRKLGIHEILEMAEAAPTTEDKIMILHNHDSVVLRQILQYAYDVRAEWLLPPGPVPYRPAPYMDLEGALYSAARRLYLFLKGGNDGLRPMKREMLFVGLLEEIHPRDAELLISVKDKKLPYKSLTPELVNEAFPGMLILPKRGPGRPRKEKSEDDQPKKEEKEKTMSKSFKRKRSDDVDEMDVQTKKQVSIDRRKKKRTDRALKTMDIAALEDIASDDDDWGRDWEAAR